MNEGVGMIGGFIPIIIVGIITGLFALPIARRKVINPTIIFLLMMIPFINGFFL